MAGVGPVDGLLAVGVGERSVGVALPEQQVHHLGVALRGCYHQGRPPPMVLAVHLAALVDQEPRALQVVVVTRIEKDRLLRLYKWLSALAGRAYLIDCVDIGTLGDQVLGDRQMAVLDGHAQGRLAVVLDRHVVDVETQLLILRLHDPLLYQLKHLLIVAFFAVQHQHLLEPLVVLLVLVGAGPGSPTVLELVLVDSDAECGLLHLLLAPRASPQRWLLLLKTVKKNQSTLTILDVYFIC